ncbi:MAG: S8 family serine peptidase, partial [Kineosporiaceae bacterium]
PTTGATASQRVVVRAVPGRQARVQALVQRLGGTVTRELSIIDGFAVTLPGGAVATLRATPDIVSVTADVSGHVMSVDPTLGYDAESDMGSLFAVTKMIGAQEAWKSGYTGKGVDVALIDTGVAPVKGLTSGNVVNGPDLSFDSQRSDLRYLDAYGHGTHMASIIAGRDAAGTPSSYENAKAFNGVAPDARIINIKVGASDGAADVSQVIAAIDWVAQHAHDYGLNIRVLNLSFGTDSTQDYHVDPLAYAAQVAWRKGVLVVVAGGNDGTKNVQLANPALDGNLLAVGAEDPMGTASLTDDTVPEFSNRGTSIRHVDVVAPGVHILGLRVPNGLVDQAYPSARVGTRFFRGSGTSQSTAVVSGAAALLFQRYPALTPQQVKMILTCGASWMAKGTALNSGAGIVSVTNAMALSSSSTAKALASTTTATFGDGSGSLELSRGSSHISLGGVALTGQKDIFGRAVGSTALATTSLAGTAWSADGTWNGSRWVGSSWTSTGDWATVTWTSNTWTGSRWVADTWTSRRWVSGSWDAATWESRRWVDSSWDSRRWVAASWS